jgi:hypothetical protein
MSDDPRATRPRAVDRALARLIESSLIVDRGAALFDRLRSRLVCSLASDRILEAYNALAFGSSPAYQPGHRDFRAEWFPWERRAVDTYFPPVPTRVLVGGAGGGREAYRLAERGYEVIAFDPVQTLVDAMPEAGTGPGHVTACVGSYERLPVLRSRDGQTVSLADLPPFGAGICGWASIAHVRTHAGRVAALRHMGALVDGPILLSVYVTPWRRSAKKGLAGGVSRWLYGDGAMFLPGIGRVQTFDEAGLRELISRAGLEVLYLDASPAVENWPHAVVRRPQ